MGIKDSLKIRLREIGREGKPIHKTFFSGILLVISYIWVKVFGFRKGFKVLGKRYNYFYYLYNATWRNERMVEIPLILDVVKKSEGKRILEVGNVLERYYSFDHDILDKYEKEGKVMNEDVVDFSPNKKYDLIVSISTLEHVGWDEKPREPEKILKAVNNLKKCLNKGGKMVVTMPLGWNKKLDELLNKKELGLDKRYFLKRISKNKWKQVDWENVKNSKYDSPFQSANAIVLGVVEK